ncbi:MAG: phage antirepressor KilAC domain-containing protein [Verrucomicrobiota bacterium]
MNITIHPTNRCVDLRQLHDELGSKRDFSTWAKDKLADFVEDLDYFRLAPAPNCPPRRSRGGQNRIDYGVTLETAKHIALMERTARGREVRDYFIEAESAWRGSKTAITTTKSPAELSRREILKMALESEEQLEELQGEVQRLTPKAAFYDRVTRSRDLLLIGQVPKLAPGMPGQNRLFQLLREDGILIKGGKQHNIPYQRYIDAGYFEVCEKDYTAPNGDVKISSTTHVTQKGVDWLIGRYATSAAEDQTGISAAA